MKKVSIWVLVVCILTFVIVGILLGREIAFKNDSKTQVEVKKENKDVLKKYLLNLNGEEYINLKENNEYEYAFLSTNNDIEIKKGTFKIDDEEIIFDSKTKAVLKDNKIIKDDDTIESKELKIKNIYFAEDKILKEFNLFSEPVKENIKNKRNESKTLAVVSSVKPTIEHCLVKENKNNIVCSIDYNVYFDEKENYTKEACENESNPKFFPYIVSSGACESTFARNWSYFEFDNKANIIGSYTGL